MTETNIESALTPISEAQRMLAEARTLPELRNLRDYATGAKAWAKARGLGISAENEATEVILRAERGIGQAILGLKAEGRIAEGAPHLRSSEVDTVISDITGFPARDKRNWQWQQLAAIEDARFEAMLVAVKALPDARLAKANFYVAIDKADRVRSGGDAAQPTATNPGMMAILSARNHLLGWETREDGSAGPTKNGLLLLPDDDLRAVAEFVKAIALAYTEARSAR